LLTEGRPSTIIAVLPTTPCPAAPDEGSVQTVNEFWDCFEDLFGRYNQQLAAGEPPLTWKELADKVGISDRTLSDWHSKRILPPNSSSLVQAAAFLGGRREDWQARWRKAREAHERLRDDRKAQRKPGNEDNRGPAETAEPSPAGKDAEGGLAGDHISGNSTSAGAGRPTRSRSRRRGTLVALPVVAAAITVIVVASLSHGPGPARPQVLPLSGHAKMHLQAVQVPLTSGLAKTLGQGGTAGARTVTGYEFRNAGNASAPVCLGALTTGAGAGQKRDPVRAVSCSTRAPSQIWIPAQWEQGQQSLTWLVNDQYPSMCLNVNEKSGDGSAAQLWDCYTYAYGPNGLAVNEAWDFGDWYANMTSAIAPSPMFLGSSDFCLDAETLDAGPSKGNEPPDGIAVDIRNYSQVAANQYWS
jgi:transcriptional regulator with XRE-family HTH domain